MNACGCPFVALASEIVDAALRISRNMLFAAPQRDLAAIASTAGS